MWCRKRSGKDPCRKKAAILRCARPCRACSIGSAGSPATDHVPRVGITESSGRKRALLLARDQRSASPFSHLSAGTSVALVSVTRRTQPMLYYALIFLVVGL